MGWAGSKERRGYMYPASAVFMGLSFFTFLLRLPFVVRHLLLSSILGRRYLSLGFPGGGLM